MKRIILIAGALCSSEGCLGSDNSPPMYPPSESNDSTGTAEVLSEELDPLSRVLAKLNKLNPSSREYDLKLEQAVEFVMGMPGLINRIIQTMPYSDMVCTLDRFGNGAVKTEVRQRIMDGKLSPYQ
ncbi:MAG: hypothetical protein LBJ69_02285 [Holosporales bacterium]|jgi:hypothetical protein|nr:hypothetical protein [Holosporales bacterium]